MTDNDIISILSNIKKMCYQRAYLHDPFIPMCDGCRFYVNKPSKRRNECQLTMLFGKLSAHPCAWDMERIKEEIEK